MLSIGNKNANHDPTNIRTVVPVVENADAPAGVERIHEIHQGPRPFGEFESVQQFAAISSAGGSG